jgi:hypothetical protein
MHACAPAPRAYALNWYRERATRDQTIASLKATGHCKKRCGASVILVPQDLPRTQQNSGNGGPIRSAIHANDSICEVAH